MTPERSKPLMRSLGELVGHVVKAIRTDPRRAAPRRGTTDEQQRGRVTLRRTTIEEIELDADDLPRRASSEPADP